MRLTQFLIISATIFSRAHAELMDSPSFEQLCSASIAVVVGEYRSYEPFPSSETISYFHPPAATFHKVRTVRGQETEIEFKVRFDFDDGSACLEPQDWKFEKVMLPREGSRWILFLTRKNDRDNIYETYRGDFGRVQEGSLAWKLVQDCDRIWASKEAHNQSR